MTDAWRRIVSRDPRPKFTKFGDHVSVGQLTETPFTRHNMLSNQLSIRLDSRLNVCICDTTGCQTGLTAGWTTGCIMYTNIQPVVKPAVQSV